MANAGRLEEAGRALETTSSLFDPQKLPEEHARSQTSSGRCSGSRDAPPKRPAPSSGRPHSSSSRGGALERGAAVFNLGLVHRELGDSEAAIRSFERALALLDSAKVPSQAAGAAPCPPGGWMER